MAETDKKSGHAKSTGDWPSLTENHWYSLAVSSAIFTALATVTAFIWIFGNGFDGDADLKMAQTLSPFGVALFAIVTFCTVGWRGSINTRQANQAEREGRAKLLQEGAKLIGETDKASHVSAGIATLEIVISGEDARLAVQALNLIADYIQNRQDPTNTDQIQAAAFDALRSGEARGHRAERTLAFKASSPSSRPEWDVVPAVSHTRFIGGTFSGFTNDYYNNIDRNAFVGCLIFGVARGLDASSKFFECEFKLSKIDSLPSSNGVLENAFTDCDFSACVFGSINEVQLASGRGNYFYQGHEPSIVSDPTFHQWERYLQARDASERNGLSRAILIETGWKQS
ncbi:hypothetical protein QTL95_22100 [Rhizobium sp. S152]|uniref:hypothetical protein n=1 Tax=Rhizobium sp. S152 TaxID=3055038 RepID=UPI0025A97C0E|nr:hypothetical protein [Rhizobium sp. S152]MDM9628593.1 hypothetical protein [Rhizobium sp. S152]